MSDFSLGLINPDRVMRELPETNYSQSLGSGRRSRNVEDQEPPRRRRRTSSQASGAKKETSPEKSG